ncbi:MAG: flagellar protein FliS [Lachnospiraceae bacterium]|nr:flagellar protein FliS [Lachnospiraceae bacterium]
MTKEEINVFSKRVAQSSKSELIVISYEIILNYIESAKIELAKENTEKFVFNVKKAKQFVNDLSSVLDFTQKISFELMNIYMFIDRCLIKSMVKKMDCELSTVESIIGKLKVAFEEVSKSDDSGAMMKNGEHIYAGLTYGRGVLNEVAIRGNTYA